MTTPRNQVWQHVVHRASFLHERLAFGWVADANQQNKEAVTGRLNRWCRLLSTRNRADFERRLAWLGLDQSSILPLLGEGRLAKMPAKSTGWIDVLVAVLQPAKNPTLPPDEMTGDLLNGRLSQPFLAIAWERLGKSAEPHLDLLSPHAKEQLTTYLVERLTELAQPTLTYLGLSAYLSSDILEYLCRTYPVLMRQLSTTVAQWEAEIIQFLGRFVADWPALALQAGQPSQLTTGMVRGIRPGLSDPHHGGCTVWRVELDQAEAVAYKPKNMTQDQAWNRLIQWCNEQGLATPLAQVWTMPRVNYGWMAWVQAAEMSSAKASVSYHQQLGMMLSLLTLFHASDVHQENLMTQATAPLLIDAEMIPYPQIVGMEAIDTLDVMRTGLLPRWRVELSGYAEIGGLSRQTDSVFYGPVQRGYQEMNCFLQQNWTKLDLPDSPLAPFRKGTSRFAPRPTDAYHRLLTHLRHPACLVNGIDFSVEADRLAVTFLQNEQYARFWPLLAQEHKAIAQGDVPIFHVELGQPDWAIPDTTIKNCLVWPAFQSPKVQDEAVMVGLIKAALDRTPYFCPSTSPTASFFDQARILGQQLADRAIYDYQGAANWVANRYQPQSGLHQHQLLADDFYTGRTGVALFLAALHQIDKAKKWRNLAQAAIQPFSGQPMTTSISGGHLYALSQIEPWLGETVIDPSRLPTKTDWPDMGIIGGQAGVIMGWLNYWHCSHQPSALSQAISQGEALLTHLEPGQDETNRFGGFAHGAAGIGYALTKLYEACGQPGFLEAACQNWAFQRALYDTPPGFWQDRRSNPPVYLENWCHGAAGIGLAAVGCLKTLPDLQDIVDRTVVILNQTNTPSSLDTLCCGQFGQIESLLEIGLRLNRDDCVDHAANLAQIIATKAAKGGYFQLYDDIPADLFNPTFFRGVAGIGYTFLRLAAARGEIDEQFPCALGWAIVG